MRMNFISRFLVLAAVSLLLTNVIFGQRTSSAASTANWETYQICEDSVSATLPGAPTEQVKTTEAADGSSFTVRTNSTSSRSSVFVVSCFDGLPFTAEKVTADGQKAFFALMMTNFTKMMSTEMQSRGVASRVTLLPTRAGVLAGRNGFEQDFSIGAFQGKAKMVLYGNRAVWSLVIAVSGTTPAAEKTAFFGSLQIDDDGLAGIVGEDM